MMAKAYYTACKYPNSLQVFVRKTRKSLNVLLDDFEKKILYPGHPALSGSTAHYTNRMFYSFPNGSEIWLAGLDNPDRLMSAQFDRAYIFEATDGVTVTDFEYLKTRLRANRTPFHQICCDCNPKAQTHWLNMRCELPYTVPPELEGHVPPPRPGQKLMTRIRCRHQDNPALWDNEKAEWTKLGASYMANLHQLTGHRRERLLLHKWVRAEGLVYQEYDPEVHLVRASCVWSDSHKCWVIEYPADPSGQKVHRIHRFIVGGDRGWTHPGSLQLWAIDTEGRMWLVKQAHHTERPQSWWADLFYEWHQQYGIWRGWYDSSEPEWIKKFNDRISAPADREGNRCMRAANKAVMTGINEVKERLKVRADGLPRQLILEDSLCHAPDKSLAEKFHPTCLQEERESYSWREIPDGKEIGKDEPEKEFDDSEDACRYATMGIYRKDTAAEPAPARPVSSHRVDWAEEVIRW